MIARLRFELNAISRGVALRFLWGEYFESLKPPQLDATTKMRLSDLSHIFETRTAEISNALRAPMLILPPFAEDVEGLLIELVPSVESLTRAPGGQFFRQPAKKLIAGLKQIAKAGGLDWLDKLWGATACYVTDHYTSVQDEMLDSSEIELLVDTRIKEANAMLPHIRIGASTTLLDSAKSKAAQIDFIFSKLGFSRRCYCSIPYVLFHELVCHVFQNYLASSPRTPAHNSCSFSEGWMDFVAMKMLDAATQSPKKEYRPLRHDHFRLGADRLYMARAESYEHSDSVVWGRDAATRLKSVLDEVFSLSPAQADETIIRFSLSANLSGLLTPKGMRLLVDLVQEYCEPQFEEGTQMASAILKCARDGNVQDFVAAINETFRVSLDT